MADLSGTSDPAEVTQAKHACHCHTPLLRSFPRRHVIVNSHNVRDRFDEIMKKHGRVPVAICVGVTAVMRKDRLNRWIVDWGREVLALWTNRPHDISAALIEDNLHPSRIEEYAGGFVRATTE